MKPIGPKMSLEELAALVCQALSDEGAEAVLVGGSVVSLYTTN